MSQVDKGDSTSVGPYGFTDKSIARLRGEFAAAAGTDGVILVSYGVNDWKMETSGVVHHSGFHVAANGERREWSYVYPPTE
jgi:hypothetical protein